MSLKKRTTCLCLTLFFFALGLFYLCPAQADLRDEARDLIRSRYVDSVPESVLNAPSIEEMLDRLGDPHTKYWTQQEYQQFIDAIDMDLSGIGITVEAVPEGAQIISVLPGTPADSAGLKAGEVIIRVDEISLEGKSVEQAVNMIRGLEGTKVTLKIKSKGRFSKKTLTRAKIDVPTVEGKRMENGSAYIDINSFGSDTAGSFGELVNQLKNGGEGWIIDLRNNGGGYLDTAQKMAGYFIGRDVVVEIRGRNVNEFLLAPEYSEKVARPVIFLVNKYSASASEILAACVKDHRKAVLIGETTYGKGTVQTLFALSDGVLKLTTARFYSPRGSTINNEGVTPDLELPDEYMLPVAELLLSGSAGEGKKGDELLRFELGPEFFVIDPQTEVAQDNWDAYTALLNNTPAGRIQAGGKNGWQDVNVADRQEDKWMYFFPGYEKSGAFLNASRRGSIALKFSEEVDRKLINKNSVRLINSETGAETPVQLTYSGKHKVIVKPRKALTPGGSYWLVLEEKNCLYDVTVKKQSKNVPERSRQELKAS